MGLYRPVQSDTARVSGAISNRITESGGGGAEEKWAGVGLGEGGGGGAGIYLRPDLYKRKYCR